MSDLVQQPLPDDRPADVVRIWRSDDFLAVLYIDGDHLRLTVNRTAQNPITGNWRERISWDELQAVKTGCGLGNVWAVEVYPPDHEVINEAAMRHLWLLDEAPTFGWRSA
ncbi:MAG: hypothetical protein Q4F65_12590 [Propionibacteriaceae bacterium]|nr:hypothetical protein [Propionibacteriaceae bacterium]